MRFFFFWYSRAGHADGAWRGDFSHPRVPYTKDSIIVRAYEDRSDLLRSLIIGPENTPYEDAPFVIDWMLDSNFPQTPPVAHFWSWTNGNGRGASVLFSRPVGGLLMRGS